MSADLLDLFDHAGRHAPASSLDDDVVIQRGRRRRARRRATVGATALVGAGVVAFGSITLAGVLPGGEQVSTGVGPAAAMPTIVSQPEAPAPSGLADPSKDGTPPAELTRVSLPSPAPGFPVRRDADTTDLTGFEADKSYWVNTYLLAERPQREIRDASGKVTGGRPTGPEVTMLVGEFPAPVISDDGTIDGHEVVSTPVVRGVTGYVTVETEKGLTRRTLYFSGADLNVWLSGTEHGTEKVTTGQLVDLGNALIGLR